MGRALSEAQVVAALGSVELFRGLPDPVLQQVASVVRPHQLDKGELLLTDGDTLLVVASGAVTAYRTSLAGEREAATVLEARESLGEVALLDGAGRPTSVEASEPTVVLSLSHPDFLGVLRAQPALLEPLLRQLGGTVRRLTDHAFLDLAGRVAKSLLRLASDGSPPVVAITQARLAEMSGGTRQSVNQVLGGFTQRGLIHLEGRQVLLTDVPGLRRRADLPAGPGRRLVDR